MTTVGMILHEDRASIARALASSPEVTRLPALTRAAVLGPLQDSLAALHDVTIADVLKLAWSTSRMLRTAARESLATGTPQHVHIDGYAVPIDYQPALDIVVANTHIATIHFGLTLTVELFGVDGVVILGRLTRLHSNTLDVTATVSVAGQTVIERKASLNLLLELPLPDGGLALAHDVLERVEGE